MKAKTKLTRLWGFLLALVMIVGMLPTTALAADTYPTASEVCVDGSKYFGEPGSYYFRNNESACSKNSTGYNAYYNPTTGTLTLNGYNGGSITVGGTKSKITVVLVGDNTITNGSLTSAGGGDITVTSDSSGTLSISQTTSGSNPAIGIETGLASSYTTGNVTIKGNAKVTINMTHNGMSTYEKAYGIFAKGNITISENASVDITCATPYNTTGGGNCNGLYAAKDVTIDTNGTIKIDVTNAGRDKDNGYSYGVYHMRTATLTKVGNMEVQWKKEGNNTRYSGGAFTKGATFSDTNHAINEDTTNCYASYRKGTPYTVTVQNGTLTGTGVKYANGSGKFLAGDMVSIKPSGKKSHDNTPIPFKEWTSEDVTLDSPATTGNNSFTVANKDVTVTATYNPFDGAPVFTRTSDSSGTIKFKTVANPDNSEFFEYVKDGETAYNRPYSQPTTTSSASPYEYSVSVSTYYAGDIKNLEAGDYRMAVTLNGERYLSEKFTVNYTAAPAGNYSDSVRVYNENKRLISLDNGECLTANDATTASSYTGGSSYVARYDKSTGTLYLKDYHGVAADGQIYANGDLNIAVESNSSFTTSVSASNNLYGIQADGKLNISGSGKLTVTANGDGDVYGIYANEGVTISAPLDVQVGKVDFSKNGVGYGIYTQSGAISLSGGDKTITATSGREFAYGVYNKAKTASTAADNGNIDISGKLTVNLINGSSNVGIYTGSGGAITLDGATVKIPGSYYCGIYNANGNVVIKSNSDVDISSDISSNRGIWTENGGSLTIDKSIVKVSSNGIVAEIYENASIKDSTVDLTLTYDNYEVIRADSTAANTIDLSGSGSVTLTATGKQDYAMFGGKVTLGTNTKCEKGTAISSWNNYAGEYDAVSNTTVLKFVHEDPAPATYTVSFNANGGTGTMADVTGVSGEYTLPENGFTAPAGKQFKAWSVGGVEKAAGDKITVTANTTVTAVWEAIEYNVTVTGGTASVGAGTPITKATMGTTVTLTAGAAPSGQMFDKWVVNGVVVDDANSATTTFVMPAGNVTAEATYKNIPVVTYTVSFDANGGTGTMADVTDISGEYTLPENGFTAPAGKQFKAWSVGGVEKAVGDKITVTANTTVTAVWEAIEYNVTVTGGTASVGAGTPITKATMGTTVTLTANAAPSGKVFDKWEVVSGGITLADVNSATTTFTMPASAVSVKATYKNAPHTHTYNQETVKPEALKTPADCTGNAVYFKSCSCGAISTTDAFVAMNTALGHAYGSDWKYDSTNHWHECSRCHDKKYEAAHDYGSDNVCDTCGYDKTVPHTHNLTLVAAKAATCTTAGNSAYYTCDGCDKWFADATGSVEITDKTSVNIPAPGHTAGTEWKSDDTNHWHECTVAGCGVIIESTKSAHTAGEWIVDTPATATTAGTKHKECTVCHRVLETQTIPSTGTELKIIAGDNQIYNKASGSDVTITCNGDFAKFTGIKVDGSVVDSSNYTAVSGSTVLTLKASYLGTLTDGSHTITFVYTDGEANTNLTVRTAGSGHIHDYGTEWKSNADNHWHECNCGDKKDEAAHSFKWVVDKEATATKKGSKHEECKTCGYKRSAVEIPATGTTTIPTDTTKPNDTTKPGNTNGSEKSPQTGDNSMMWLWIALLFVSGFGVVTTTVYTKKRKSVK